MKRKKAFTLIEMLIATFIFALAITMVMISFYFSSSFQSKNTSIRNTSQTARAVIDTLSRDVRYADNVSTVDTTDLKCPVSSCLKITKDGHDSYYYLTGPTGAGVINYSDGVSSSAATPSDINVTEFNFVGNSVNKDNSIRIYLVLYQIGAKETESSLIAFDTRVAKRGYRGSQ